MKKMLLPLLATYAMTSPVFGQDLEVHKRIAQFADSHASSTIGTAKTAWITIDSDKQERNIRIMYDDKGTQTTSDDSLEINGGAFEPMLKLQGLTSPGSDDMLLLYKPSTSELDELLQQFNQDSQTFTVKFHKGPFEYGSEPAQKSFALVAGVMTLIAEIELAEYVSQHGSSVEGFLSKNISNLSDYRRVELPSADGGLPIWATVGYEKKTRVLELYDEGSKAYVIDHGLNGIRSSEDELAVFRDENGLVLEGNQLRHLPHSFARNFMLSYTTLVYSADSRRRNLLSSSKN